MILHQHDITRYDGLCFSRNQKPFQTESIRNIQNTKKESKFSTKSMECLDKFCTKCNYDLHPRIAENRKQRSNLRSLRPLPLNCYCWAKGQRSDGIQMHSADDKPCRSNSAPRRRGALGRNACSRCAVICFSLDPLLCLSPPENCLRCSNRY